MEFRDHGKFIYIGCSCASKWNGLIHSCIDTNPETNGRLSISFHLDEYGGYKNDNGWNCTRCNKQILNFNEVAKIHNIFLKDWIPGIVNYLLTLGFKAI